MYNLTERNEQRSRRSALVIAIGLHLVLAAALYYYSAQKPQPDYSSTPARMAPHSPHPKAVNLP